jgi:hypothetical protein
MHRHVPPSIVLPKGVLWRPSEDGPLTVRCLSGCVWVTADGDTRDFVLYAGRSERFLHGRSLVVHAIEPSAVEVAEQPDGGHGVAHFGSIRSGRSVVRAARRQAERAWGWLVGRI